MTETANPVSRRTRAALILFVTASVIAPAALFWRNHRVHPDALVDGIYRTSQPSGRQLLKMISALHLRTIINLRGSNVRRSWYRDEEAETRKTGVGLINLPFETFDWPPQFETRALVGALDSAPRPILLHCESGVDRSGWAGAIVLILNGRPYDEALQQMSILRGHFCRRSICPLHRFFDIYQKWLAEKRLPHSSQNFRRWVMTVYCPEPYNASFRLMTRPPSIVAPDEELIYQVAVTNDSHSMWASSADRRHGMRMGVRMIGPFTSAPLDALPIFRKPHTTARDVFRESSAVTTTSPHESRIVLVRVRAPHQPGLYVLQFDMVDEMVHWFSDLGGPGLLLPVQVTAAKRG
ncbi:MAG TPA: tyrosine-protein phosphatase [Thermoanaerobaculia bacterium]|nr:tyrosine-protein phosphatase [Thermoanaerobaculia bacterium]